MAQFSSDNQPEKRKGRGPSEKTKILNAMKAESRTEEEFYQMLVRRSFDPDDNLAIKEVLSRIAPIAKSVMPHVEFDFDKTKSPTDQAGQIIEAASNAEIPPDVAALFLQTVKHASDIEANTDLKLRLEKLEAMVNG